MLSNPLVSIVGMRYDDYIIYMQMSRTYCTLLRLPRLLCLTDTRLLVSIVGVAVITIGEPVFTDSHSLSEVSSSVSNLLEK